MAQRTRNKIAQAVPAGLRVLPVLSAKCSQPRTRNRVSKNLDEIDLKILSEIQADGRITNVELAKRVGISPPPCLRRVRTLEEEGYIQGYRGLLDPRRLGFDVTVFASVHLSSQADTDLRAFEDFVRAEPLVRECWMLSGEVDFILKCVAPDMATFQNFVTHLTAAPHVVLVREFSFRNSRSGIFARLLSLKARQLAGLFLSVSRLSGWGLWLPVSSSCAWLRRGCTGRRPRSRDKDRQSRTELPRSRH